MGKQGTVQTEKGYQCKLVRYNDSTEEQDLYLAMITLGNYQIDLIIYRSSELHN